jgi:hypothetical protein
MSGSDVQLGERERTVLARHEEVPVTTGLLEP